MEKTVHINGMMCKHCVKHVSDALNKLDGIEAVVTLETNSALVKGEAIDDAVITKAIVDAGYEVTGIE